MSKIQIYLIAFNIILLSGCVSGASGPRHTDGWKGRSVNEFIKKWETSGYVCKKSKQIAVNDKHNKLSGGAKCYKSSTVPICSRFFTKSVIYDLESDLIQGRVLEDTGLNCF